MRAAIDLPVRAAATSRTRRSSLLSEIWVRIMM
jgi:hypothetical protein